jgi:transposase-like protein
VDLLHRYSKHEPLLETLKGVLGERSDQQRLPQETRQRQNHLSKVDQLNVVAAYQSGRSVHDLALDFSVTRQTAAAILQRHGVQLRSKVLTPNDIERATKMYVEGASLRIVGEQLGVNASTVRRVLLAAGVQTRPNGTNQWR